MEFIRAIVTVLDAGDGGKWTIINKEFTALNLATLCGNINRNRNSTATQASTERYLRNFFSNTKLNYIAKELGIDLISKYRLQSTKNDENLISTILQDPYVNQAPQNSMNGEQNNIDIPNERTELQETSTDIATQCTSSEEQTCNELKTLVATCTIECLLSLIREIRPALISQRNQLIRSKYTIYSGLISDILEFYTLSKIQYNMNASFIVENNHEFPIVFTLYQFFTNLYAKIVESILISNKNKQEITFHVDQNDLIYYQNKRYIQFGLFYTSAIFDGIKYCVKTFDVVD